jgi:hypothetical protein
MGSEGVNVRVQHTFLHLHADQDKQETRRSRSVPVGRVKSSFEREVEYGIDLLNRAALLSPKSRILTQKLEDTNQRNNYGAVRQSLSEISTIANQRDWSSDHSAGTPPCGIIQPESQSRGPTFGLKHGDGYHHGLKRSAFEKQRSQSETSTIVDEHDWGSDHSSEESGTVPSRKSTYGTLASLAPGSSHGMTLPQVATANTKNALAMSPAEGTTLMLRNIACKYTEGHVKHILDSMGFKGAYDVVHVPHVKSKGDKHRRWSNLGYAFVNFKSADYADWCRRHLTGQVFGWAQGSTKTCEVSYADEQGFENLMLRRESSHTKAIGQTQQAGGPSLQYTFQRASF